MADGHPLVAVVMPAFNAGRTILAAVRSVLGQSYGSVQLVVCDDASTDATAEILGAIPDPRLLVLRNASNLGQGPARDRAIAATSAPWIAVIDADDVWDPGRIERLMGANAADLKTMVFDDLMLCHDAPSGLVPWRRLHGEDAFGCHSVQPRIVPLEKFITAPRLLIKPIFPGDVVREHDVRHSNRRFGEDIEFFLRLAAFGVQLRYVPEPLYHYRISPGSATAAAGQDSAMRECVEACSKLEGLSENVRQAFDFKIRSLSENEDVYSFARNVRSGRLLRALSSLLGNPKLLLLVTRRTFRFLGYEAHRILNSGSRRKLF
jgi:succinoglycan biosynthesis protein ExoO